MTDRIWTPADLRLLAERVDEFEVAVEDDVIDALLYSASRLRLLEEALQDIAKGRGLIAAKVRDGRSTSWSALQHIARAALGRQP